MQRGRELGRRCVLGAVVATLTISSPGPTTREVQGSSPDPGTGLARLLESQGEHARAWRELAAAAGETSAPMRLRLANRTGDARAALSELDLHPAAFDARLATLVRATLELRGGAPEKALAALERGPVPEGLEAWASFVEAEAAIAAERWDAAERAAERVPTSSLAVEMRHRLAVVRGLVALHRDDRAAMAKLGPELGEAARRDDRTGLLLFDLARAARRDGDIERGRSWLVDLLEARPTPAESAYAELLRVAGGDFLAEPDNALAVAHFEVRTGRHEKARDRLREALRGARGAELRARILLEIAGSQVRTADYADALATLSQAAPHTQGTRLEAERLRVRARAERRSGATKAAMGSYAELARRFPAHAAADDALSEIGWLHEARGALEEAEAAYVRAARAYPTGALADDCALRAGLCALRDGRPATAIDHFQRLVSGHPRSTLLDNALYWQLVAALRRGEAERALGLGERLSTDFPRSYFTVLAHNRLEPGLGRSATRTAESPERRGAGSDAGLARAAHVRAAAESALALLRAGGLGPPPGFATQTRLWRFFLDHGFATEALWEARRLERLYDTDPGALSEMIALASERGAHERLVRWGWLLGQRLPDPERREAIDILLFPAPFAPALAEAASRYGLSHAVVLGLMRQESAFDPAIDSGAGARGLMQLMPEVGRRLWPGVGSGPYHPDSLYQPDTNIELGCKLLAAEIERAGGDLAQALAAYNAGGEVAEAWTRRLRPKDPPEMYVDLVEYSETRNYLKTVLGNIETYRRLYALP